MDIFLSYSSDDKASAEELRKGLMRYFQVFFATHSIPGGVEWEREIDRAIRSSKVFLPLVTKSSNDSPWVTKETLLAIAVGIPTIPVLFSDYLPLRLIDRQFVDFRDDFNSGFSDLLSVLSKHLGPVRQSPASVDLLIAKAVRARLSGKLRLSNALVERFTGLDSNIASTGYSFWKQLESTLNTNLAKNIGRHLKIIESTKLITNGPYKEYDSYEWTLKLHAENRHLDLVDFVVYELHPTFENRIQKVRARTDNFRIQRIGWGPFPVGVRVKFVDYTELVVRYMLTFTEYNQIPLASRKIQ